MKHHKVIEKEFYHIHTLNDKSNVPNKHSEKWVQGRVLSFGYGSQPDNNLLSDRVYNPYINLEWEKNHIKLLSKKRIINDSPKRKKEIQLDFYQRGLMFKYFKLTSEIVLEEVRQSLYPEKPSRLTGIWLSEKQYLTTWLNLIPSCQFSQKVFLVKFTGKLHKADGRWISNLTLSFDNIYKNAIGYWNGELKSKMGEPHEEFIGNGSIEIIKEIKICEIGLLSEMV